jgi:hypothetical protein
MANDEAPKKTVIRMRQRPEVVRDLVRRLAQNSSNIQWRTHALERMVERDITDEMALEVLREGQLRGDIVSGERPDELKLKMVREIKGRRQIGVVVVVVKSQRLRVVTVEWEDVR